MSKIQDILASSSTFGDKVRLLREARGLTLRDLASRVGVSAPFLSDLEHSRRLTDKLAELAKALGVEEADLRRVDPRLSVELKEWLSAHPEVGNFLEEYRQSGRPVEELLQTLRASTERGRRR